MESSSLTSTTQRGKILPATPPLSKVIWIASWSVCRCWKLTRYSTYPGNYDSTIDPFVSLLILFSSRLFLFIWELYALAQSIIINYNNCFPKIIYLSLKHYCSSDLPWLSNNRLLIWIVDYDIFRYWGKFYSGESGRHCRSCHKTHDAYHPVFWCRWNRCSFFTFHFKCNFAVNHNYVIVWINFVYEYVYLYHAIEDTANQSTGKLLYIQRFYIPPSHHVLCIIMLNLFCWPLYFQWHGMK